MLGVKVSMPKPKAPKIATPKLGKIKEPKIKVGTFPKSTTVGREEMQGARGAIRGGKTSMIHEAAAPHSEIGGAMADERGADYIERRSNQVRLGGKSFIGFHRSGI